MKKRVGDQAKAPQNTPILLVKFAIASVTKISMLHDLVNLTTSVALKSI